MPCTCSCLMFGEDVPSRPVIWLQISAVPSSSGSICWQTSPAWGSRQMACLRLEMRAVTPTENGPAEVPCGESYSSQRGSYKSENGEWRRPLLCKLRGRTSLGGEEWRKVTCTLHQPQSSRSKQSTAWGETCDPVEHLALIAECPNTGARDALNDTWVMYTVRKGPAPKGLIPV